MTPVVVECLPEDAASVVAGRGQNEEPLSEHGIPNLGRGETTPFCIEPARGKVSKDVGEPKRNVSGDVLEEDEGGPDLVEDSTHVGPQMALVEFASPASCDREGLARVARCDEIHDSAPRAAVEGSEIVPDRSTIQVLVFHPGHEDGRRECFPLDVTNGPDPSSQRGIGPADPGTQAEGT
jgi:hypothetical protein